MGFIEIFLIALSLSADAFAVSVSAGSTGLVKDYRSNFRISFHFGFFQFIMPLLGWCAGINIMSYVEAIDHWIAFGLLVCVGVKMLIDSTKKDQQKIFQDPSKGVTLVVLSIATSLDALAIGFSLAMLNVSIWYPAVIIGIVTSIVSLIGIRIGYRFSKSASMYADIIGGVLLMIIGVKILLSHIYY